MTVPRNVAALAVAVLMILLFTGCGRDQSDVVSYFSEISELSGSDRELEEALAAARQDLPHAEDDVKVSLLATFLQRFQPVLEDLREGLETITPPREIRSEHNRFLASVAALEEATERTAEKLAGLDSWEEARRIVAADLLPALVLWDRMCQELLRVAAVEPIDGGFSCPGLLPLPDTARSFGVVAVLG